MRRRSRRYGYAIESTIEIEIEIEIMIMIENRLFGDARGGEGGYHSFSENYFNGFRVPGREVVEAAGLDFGWPPVIVAPGFFGDAFALTAGAADDFTVAPVAGPAAFSGDGAARPEPGRDGFARSGTSRPSMSRLNVSPR